MRAPNYLLSIIALAPCVSSAFAADDLPTIVIPEPVQYVPIEGKCAYFTSEICTIFKGELRTRLVLPGEFDELTIDPVTNSIGLSPSGGKSYESRVRGRFDFEAIRDLEVGELKSKLRLQAESKSPRSGDASFGIDQAYIQLRPLFVGYSDSAWSMTTNDGGTGFGGFGIFDGAYGDQQRNVLQYQVNDLEKDSTFFAVSLEDDGDMTSWTPDLVGRFGAAFGKHLVFAVVGYDQDNGLDSAVWNALGGAALGAGTPELGFGFGYRTSSGPHEWRLQGYYATGNTAYRAELDYLGVTWTPQWSVLGSYRHKHSNMLLSYINGQYFADVYTPTNTDSGMQAWTVSGGFEWRPSERLGSKLQVRVEGKYTHVDTNGYFNAFGTPREDLWEAVMQLEHKF